MSDSADSSQVDSSQAKASPEEGDEGQTKRRRRALRLAILSAAVEIGALRAHGYSFGGNVVVRCKEGHLFTTLWIPVASVKALRLGPWRFQRCPVGSHWSLVKLVKESELGEHDLRLACEHRDVRLP